jgi:hypothetical protein
MRITEIAYNIAVPASKLDIFKYIITAGKYGKLFVGSRVEAKKYWADQDHRTSTVNCRCTLSPLTKDDYSFDRASKIMEKVRSDRKSIKANESKVNSWRVNNG